MGHYNENERGRCDMSKGQQPMIDFWDFKKKVTFDNRHLQDHNFLKYLSKYQNYTTVNLDPDKCILFRARICETDYARARGFAPVRFGHPPKRIIQYDGYDAKDSFPFEDPKRIRASRVNADYIRVLYTAMDEYTAISEVHPNLQTKVSVAKIRIKEPLKIMGFELPNDLDLDTEFGNYLYAMWMLFSLPSSDSQVEYVCSQYIASKIKELGYDGIGYPSSQNFGGKNLAIFKVDSCFAVSSKVYLVSDIKYKIEECFSQEHWPSILSD